ncbi:MAG: hypothetical protein Q9174_000211 [Haloplaca sp. 1 TL-2023]
MTTSAESSKRASRESSKTFETFDYTSTQENVNSLPGANAHTAGGKPPQFAGFTDALKTIGLGDFKEIHKKPCHRESFLTGIGAAFSVGGARLVLGACGWAVATFVFGSAGVHEYCQYKRRVEKYNVKRMQEALEEGKKRKMAEQAKKNEADRKARKKTREESVQSASNSWAFWKKPG